MADHAYPGNGAYNNPDHSGQPIESGMQRPPFPMTSSQQFVPRPEMSDEHSVSKIPFFGKKAMILGLQDQIAAAEGEINRLRTENAKISQAAAQVGAMNSVEKQAHIAALDAQLADRSRSLQALERDQNQRILTFEQELRKYQSQVRMVKAELLEVNGRAELDEAGLYDFDNDANNSVTYSDELKQVKAAQKAMVREKRAVTTTSVFTFNNSVAKGQSFLNSMSKMALNAYNSEAENCIKSVKAGNLATAKKRLERSAEKLARFGDFIDLRVNREYQRLRIRELELTSLYLQAVQAEKVAAREKRAEMREQARAQRELEAEKAKLEKEQEHYKNAYKKLLATNGDAEELERLKSHLNEIDKSLEDVDYRVANIRAGYVYVISDIGAFGDRMVKIGMTRRLDPMDRVRELGDASVPFKFDVHALFFSQDAVSLETMLHHEFDDRRVNRVNNRKEFFYCTPEEVLAKLKEKHVAIVEYKVEPTAEEYHLSQQLATKPVQQ